MPKLFRDRTLPALCPFCRAEVARPAEVEGGQWYDFAGGFCDCGAVFALDPTARNGGAVFLQALLVAADGDMDRAMGLAEGVGLRRAATSKITTSNSAPPGPQCLRDPLFCPPAAARNDQGG